MLLQSLLRPVLTPLMRGMFDAPIFSSSAWSPLALWPDGIATPGMWISPRDLTSQWADYTGTTPVSVPGTVADASNPVGLALDIRAGATVLTDPGLHMLQSTSAARPLLSARTNLLTYTEDFAAFDWASKQFMTVDSDAIPPPSGFTSVDKLIGTADVQTHRLLKSSVVGLATVSWVVKSAELRRCALLLGSPFAGAWFDSTSGTCGVLTDYPDTVDQSIEDLGGGFCRCSVTANLTASSGNGVQFVLMPDGATSFGASTVAMDGLGLYATGAQLNYGGATDYQSVPGDGSTYASGPPIAQKYDGVDDGMATAAFSAGTLIDGMDCMIPVRRDSAAACIAGLYNGIADATKFFGMAESASGSGCVGSGAGTPTVWVDNTQLTGGTAVTRGTLHTALTVGDWHILEFRNLDLSTWTAAGFGLYTSYVFPGPRGDIMLFPSTASTADKNAARADLAAYYGVTLA